MRLSSFVKDIFKSPIHNVTEGELERINKDLYERNVELAIRNRTLSVLRKLYDIINTSLGVKLTAQKLIEEIVIDLKFRKGFIALLDRERKKLNVIAVSTSNEQDPLIREQYNMPFQNFSISMEEKNNFCVDAVLNNRRRLTNVLHDIFAPAMSKQISLEIQEKLTIKTAILYPISFGGQVLGVLMLGMDKHIGELSRAERETLHELIEVVSIAIERVQIYEDLQLANEQLKELDKLKDEFVYVASHELRTPMTAIKNYLWLALNKHKETLTDQLKQDLERAYISTERLIHLVQDMLTVSRIEGKRLIFDFKETHMGKLAQQVVDELASTAKEKQLALTVVPVSDDYIVNIDQTRIIEVLYNLIGNSLKFTPPGGTITVSIRRNNNMVETSVSDTGCGIPKEDISRLFQKFGRLGHSYKRLHGETGTGLGLFISKQIVEAHGGKIWADSKENEGSTFAFSLPAMEKTIDIK